MNPSEQTKRQTRTQDRDLLPHRKILILGAICISIIVIILTAKISKEKKLLIEKSNLAVVAGISADELSADAKIIEALNKAKIESLGILASSTNPFDPSPKDSVSDRFTKDIFSAYLKYQKDGVLPDGDSFVGKLEYLDVSDINKNKYNLSYLKIFYPTNNNEIKNYGNIFAKTFLNTIKPVDQDIIKYNSDINQMIPIYKNIGENLMKISVPAAIANEHLQLANQYLKQADAFLLVGGEEKDPVKALLGLQVVREGIPIQVDMFTRIKKYIADNGIIYEKEEPGNFWNVGTTTVSLQQ